MSTQYPTQSETLTSANKPLSDLQRLKIAYQWRDSTREVWRRACDGNHGRQKAWDQFIDAEIEFGLVCKEVLS